MFDRMIYSTRNAGLHGPLFLTPGICLTHFACPNCLWRLISKIAPSLVVTNKIDKKDTNRGMNGVTWSLLELLIQAKYNDIEIFRHIPEM